MKPAYRGIAVALTQCLIVLSVAGKYEFDRVRLPRVWAKAAPVDPNLPVRGRYVSLRLEVSGQEPGANDYWRCARLSIQNGRLVATPVAPGTALMISRSQNQTWALTEPVAFFIPEHIPDPSRRAPDEELWVEVSLPKNGPPRLLRLGVKKNGVLTPLDLP